jgi:hypothetical protein
MKVFVRGIVFAPHCFFASLKVFLWGIYGLPYTTGPPYRMYKRRILMAPKAIIIWLCVVVTNM